MPSKTNKPSVTPEPNRPADFIVETHGSIYLMRPMNDGAEQWLKEHVDAEPYMYFGKALAVERRYISEIVRGAIEAGYIVI